MPAFPDGSALNKILRYLASVEEGLQRVIGTQLLPQSQRRDANQCANNRGFRFGWLLANQAGLCILQAAFPLATVAEPVSNRRMHRCTRMEHRDDRQQRCPQR